MLVPRARIVLALAGEASRFVVVGILNTAVHVTMAVALIELAGYHPVPGNLLAFLAALIVGYAGNALWTFRGRSGVDGLTFGRYILVALSGVVYNAAVMALAVEVFRLGYQVGLAAIIMSWPAMSFLIMRYWVFPRSLQARTPSS